MRHLIFIFLTIRLFAEPIDDLTPSSPEEIASLRTDFLIGGWINPISGQIVCTEDDLHIHAAQDLILQRSYLPAYILGRYEDKGTRDRFELAQALSQVRSKGWIVLPHLFCGINGKSRYFQVPDSSGCILEFKLKGQESSLATSSVGMSNLNGEEPSSEADWRNTKLFVDDNNAHVQTPQGTKRIYRRIAGGPFLLEQEILNDGKVIRYEYQNKRLSKISSTDLSGRFVYATIDVQDMKHFIGSDGTRADYNYETRAIQGKKKKIICRHSPDVLTLAANPFYNHSAAYNDRLQLFVYDSKDYPINCQYSRIKDHLSQVTSLSTPSDTISISYDSPQANIKGGWTSVTDANGLTTIYRFNEKLLLTAIENYNGSLVNQKRFTYDERQHIRTIEISDGQGNPLLIKHYECDEAGNPLLEQRTGDFGSFTIHRKFDANRLTEESSDDGLSIQWTYLDSTRLITSKTILDHGSSIRKTTFQYDQACNLIQETEEGRTVTDYLLRQQAPHLHRVEWKIEKDWNQHLIRKTHYDYDQWGHICSEAVYGSDNALAYTIERTFNAKGELLRETNPLGLIATYEYNDRGRCIHEIPFSHTPIHRIFDAKGRLIQLSEGDHSTTFNYDPTDLLIEKIDYLGQSTHYTYHPVHRKPTLITSSPTEKKITYDAFGRPILIEDGEGNQTRTTYNSYGSPVQIIHSGSGIERFEYAPNGDQIRHVDADGIATVFTYDVLKRLISETTGPATTLYKYNGYECIEETHALGIPTHYVYNTFGQKIKEETAGRITTFGYDPLGFLNSIEKSGRITTIQNDSLGRPLERTVAGRLKTTYTYDPSGNTTSITQRGTTYFHYDPYQRLIDKTDPLGNVTTITYIESDHSLIQKTKDPRGIETIEYYDPHHCLLKQEVDGIPTQEFAYNRNLQKVRQDQLTFTYTSDGNLASMTDQGRTTRYSYTPAGRLQTKQRPDDQILSYQYDSLGHLCQIGDQSIEYDPLGRLIGGSGFHRTLDAFGNILKEEFTNGLYIETQYDEHDRPLEHTLPDHSKIIYEYGSLFLEQIHRLSPDGSVLYTHTYDLYSDAGDLLLEDHRTSYEYDLLGRLTQQKDPVLTETISYDSIGNLIQKGHTSYSYDVLSQMTDESDCFTARYDAHYNSIELNGQAITPPTDANGNLLRNGYVYDMHNRLIEASGERYTYDAIGRRLTNGSIAYLYLGDEEIGSYENGSCKELQIPGLHRAIAIEKDSISYRPIYDVQGTIRYLIDRSSDQVAEKNDSDAFGRHLNPHIPYAYMGKRLDVTGQIYFGQRYYDPNLSRWLTPDPAGPLDSSNLYQYVFNNPLAYQDPDGQFVFAIPLLVWGAELMMPTLTAIAMPLIYTAVTGAVAYAGYELVQKWNQAPGDVWSRLPTCADQTHNPYILNREKVEKNTNPFDGPVNGDVVVVDGDGNAIPVKEGNWLTGSKNGKWIQEMEPNEKEGQPTGARKDGGHPPGPKHPDPRGWKPHGHVPGTTNSDGTPWLPIN